MRNIKSYDEFQKKSPLMKEIDMLYGDKINSLWIFEDTDSIYLDQIIIKPQFRNEGLGSDIMNMLVTHADREGKTVGVTPVDEFGSNIGRLKMAKVAKIKTSTIFKVRILLLINSAS